MRLLPLAGLAATLLPITSLFAAAPAAQDPAYRGWPPITAVMRPWTRWWWMGSAVDPVNLDRELNRYKAAGLGGVEITPIYGAVGWEDRYIQYLSPKWMEMLNHTIATASSLGMITDMATGTGWCFGGPTVSATDANAVVVAATQQVQPGASLTGTFSPAATQALIAFSQDGKSIDLTSKIDPQGHVNWTADTAPYTVYAISQKPSGVVVKRAAPGGDGPMLNPFYADAIRRYMQWFEGPFAVSKPKLDALFQDSYEYNSQWSPDFFAQFEKLRGYKLQTELPALLGSAPDDEAARVKSDYRETISDMMLGAMPIWVRWAHAHGYQARYQAHGDPGNLLDLYAIADIPETEMIYTSRNLLVSKFASSAAHVTGKRLTSSETGTWLAEHFTETLDGMKTEVDDLFLAGINHVLYHGTAYSPDEVPWPGWCFYASTEMNPRNSIWHDVPTLNAYITRAQSILQSGRSDNDVLVYWPIFDRWNDAQGMVQNFDIRGAWFVSAPIGVTAQHLWDGGYAFDYVSDRQLTQAAAEDGNISLGHQGYKVIVVPPCHLMPVETLKQLLRIASAGCTVVFQDKLPDDLPGWADLTARRAAFKALLAGIHLNQSGAVQQAAIGKGRILVGDVDAALDLTTALPEKSITDHPGLHYIRRTSPGEGTWYFIVNRGTQPVDGPVALGHNSPIVELMDPITGHTGQAEARRSDGKSQFRLQLDPGESIIAHTGFPLAGRLNQWEYRSTGAPTEVTGTWNVKFIDGGPTLPPPFQTRTLTSWTTLGGPEAQAFAGTALYSLSFDAPGGQKGPWTIKLGNVCQSARVRLNGKPLGTVIAPPYSVEAPALLPKGNLLEVEVTNVSANRVRDLDIRHVPWKDFHNVGLLNVKYKHFDASGWPLTDSGLLGPVTLQTH